VGVVGGGSVDEATLSTAAGLGRAIAERGWVLLTGGRAAGVMAAASKAAHEAGGLVVGVLPGRRGENGVADGVDLAIYTGMGDARNVINVLSADVIIALPGGAGTLSEVALALKSGCPVVVLGRDVIEAFERWGTRGRMQRASSVAEAMAAVQALLDAR